LLLFKWLIFSILEFIKANLTKVSEAIWMITCDWFKENLFT